MPITRLPEDTFRRLGSTLVIANPLALLKELLDNAIDSGATSIEVLVSPDAVEKIEVRDNGCGISPEDYNLLGRPGCTSKISSFEDLPNVAGRTLGFRGSALASASVVGNVFVTTRQSTDHVATSITLARGGGVQEQRHVAAPGGTTVTVTKLFATMPVRHKVAVKDTDKTLAGMKELLQAYILARPGLRFRFMVSKMPGLSWSYAPSQTGGAKEAAMKLFGIEHAAQCTVKTSLNAGPPRMEDTSSAQLPRPESQMVFEALTPSLNADPNKLFKGAFLSVDGRPISSGLGTGKRLLSIFKECLAERLPSISPRDAFIRLDIRCPPGGYDVNVEPSKNDVLFDQEQVLLDQFRDFLHSVYPPPDEASSPQSIPTSGTVDSEGTEATSLGSPGQRRPPEPTTSQWKVDMAAGFEASDTSREEAIAAMHSSDPSRRAGNEALAKVPSNGTQEHDEVENEKEGLNPWTIAKLASIGRRREQPVQSPTNVQEKTTSFGTNQCTAYEPEQCRVETAASPYDYPSSPDSAHGGRRTLERRSNQGTRGSQALHLGTPPKWNADGTATTKPQTRNATSSRSMTQSQLSFTRGPGQPRGTLWENAVSVPKSLPSRGSQRTTSRNPIHLELDDGFSLRQITEPRLMTSMFQTARSLVDSPAHNSGALVGPQHWPAAPNPSSRRPKRVKTELLPLETIPPGSQTCVLVLTLETGNHNLTRMLSELLRFDLWVADGRLKVGLGEDIDPENAAMLVQPLLAQVGSEEVVMAQEL